MGHPVQSPFAAAAAVATVMQCRSAGDNGVIAEVLYYKH